MKNYTGIELYRGPSLLNGAPIVAIATLHSQNAKTGDLVQTWILAADQTPAEAVHSGEDEAICGGCPHRHHTGGACYVLPWQAPTKVYRSWLKGRYPVATKRHINRLAGRGIRFGSYGDPAAVPAKVWQPLLEVAAFATGYTHQPNEEVTAFCMASADSEQQALAYQASGMRTFRVKTPEDPLLKGEILCPASVNEQIQCIDCRICQGGSEGVNVAIDAHGQRAKRFDLIALAA
jgi:hypothetical protein